jgi:hypothetical protein
MRRKRHRGETKVWRDPHVVPARNNSPGAAEPASESDGTPAAEGNGQRRRSPQRRRAARIIAEPPGEVDPRELERERMLQRLLEAAGRPSISRAADAFLDAGFEFPASQAVWLQLLEHKSEDKVAEAIGELSGLLEENPPERRAVLDSRLRRIEEYADEPSTQQAAGRLRRMLNGHLSPEPPVSG